MHNNEKCYNQILIVFQAIFGVSTLVAAGMTWSYPTTHKKQLLMTFTEAEEFYEKHFRRNRSSSHTSSQSKYEFIGASKFRFIEHHFSFVEKIQVMKNYNN